MQHDLKLHKKKTYEQPNIREVECKKSAFLILL